ncbi:MAG TPA: DUF6627 family protein [Gammaproteobacteria bacterium]
MKARQLFRTIGVSLCAALLGTLQVVPAQAAMVGTASVIRSEQAGVDREQLALMLEREDIRQQLVELGVEPDHAQQRIALMTDAEVASLNQRLQELPAGSDVLGILLVIFIVFVITDAIGATDIFPFVDPVR